MGEVGGVEVIPESVLRCAQYLFKGRQLRANWRLRTTEADYIIVYSGDWIITGAKGEKYSCEPSIFEAIYELVPNDEYTVTTGTPLSKRIRLTMTGKVGIGG